MYGFQFNNEEISALIRSIKETYNFDFSGFAMIPFRHRVSELMKVHSIFSVDEVIYRMGRDEGFYEIFLKEIAVSETEIFRDTVIWRIIRFDIIKELYEKGSGKIRIWIPGCSTGDELYSLAILLRENYFNEKVEILASSLSAKCIEQIKSGNINLKRHEINLANYQRYKGKADFSEYCILSHNKASWDTSLIENVEFLPPQSLFKNPPEKINLILFRNRMLYYSFNLQYKVLITLHRSLAPEGYLVIGAKETLSNFNVKDRFSAFNEKESIYKKIGGI